MLRLYKSMWEHNNNENVINNNKNNNSGTSKLMPLNSKMMISFKMWKHPIWRTLVSYFEREMLQNRHSNSSLKWLELMMLKWRIWLLPHKPVWIVMITVWLLRIRSTNNNSTWTHREARWTILISMIKESSENSLESLKRSKRRTSWRY